MEKVIEVNQLRKEFGGLTAVDGISFAVKQGEIVGLLGPNGAGKTTTINMLLGLTKPASGQIRIFGLDLATHRQAILKKVGYASAELRMQDRLTIFENLFVFAMLFEINSKRETIDYLLKEMEILDLKNKPFQDLSSGQKTRAILCKALLNQPELLLLDEPTASLDPEISERVETYLLRLQGFGKTTMLYTSHDMGEVTRLCDRIIFLHQGKIIAQDTPINLTRELKETVLEFIFSSSLMRVKEFCAGEGLDYQIPEPNHLLITTAEERVAAVLSRLTNAGIEITDIQIKRPDLKDVFIKFAREGKGVVS